VCSPSNVLQFNNESNPLPIKILPYTNAHQFDLELQVFWTLQHTATQCNTVQHSATHCNTLQHTASHYNSLQHTPIDCSVLQHTATHSSTLQHTATRCSTLQHTIAHTTAHTAAHCNTLHDAATHCSLNTVPYTHTHITHTHTHHTHTHQFDPEKRAVWTWKEWNFQHAVPFLKALMRRFQCLLITEVDSAFRYKVAVCCRVMPWVAVCCTHI